MAGARRTEILRYDPLQRLLRRALAVLLLALCIALAYWLGARAAGEPRPAPEPARAELESRLAETDGERADLAQQLANAGAALNVERAASAQVRGELAAAQARIRRLEQQSDLYRGLLGGAGAGRTGLVVHEIAIEPGDRPGTFHYRVVLLQRAQRYVELSGNLGISVRGQANGAQRTLRLADIGVPRGVDRLPVRLLYFQFIEGELEIPAGFRPEEVTVEVELAGRGRSRVTSRKAWPI